MEKKWSEMTEEEKVARRSAAAKKAAATRAAKKAEEEAKAKAEAEEKSSTSTSAVAIVDGTEAKAEAANDTASANAKVADNGTKAEASTNGDGTSSSSSAVIVLPAGDTGKNEANTQSATFVAPATNSDNKNNKKEGTVKKVLNFIFGALILVLLALLIICGLYIYSRNNGANTTTPSAAASTAATTATASADEEDKISALSAALAAEKAENASIREQNEDLKNDKNRLFNLLDKLAEAGVNVVFNDGDVDVTVTFENENYVSATQYNQLYYQCENFKVANSNLTAQIKELEGELSIWNNHICSAGSGCDGSCGISELQKKYNDLLKKWENHTCPSCDGSCSYCKDLKKDLEKKDRKIQELENQLKEWENHTCPSCDGSCSYCKDLKKDLEKKDRKIQELENQLKEWENHVCTGGCDGNCWYAQMWNNHTCSGCDGSCECGGSTGGTSTSSGTPEFTSWQPEAKEPPEGDGSTITSPDKSDSGSLTGGN